MKQFNFWTLIGNPKVYDVRIKRQPIIGEKYERLTITSNIIFAQKPKNTNYHCVAICSCGNHSKTYRYSSLTSMAVRSCGCYKTDLWTTHGLSETKIYAAWLSMMRRCYCEKDSNYSRYGKRGIRVSEEFQDVNIFYEWAINNGFQEGLQIDRIDVNGHYDRDNVRWATQAQNACNKRPIGGTSQYKGVSRQNNRWRVSIGHNKKTIFVGSYIEEKDAARAYNQKAIELHKEFAHLNVIDDAD